MPILVIGDDAKRRNNENKKQKERAKGAPR
jgi:hypothetical protein